MAQKKHKVIFNDKGMSYRGVKLTPRKTATGKEWTFLNPAIGEEVTVENVNEAIERIDFYYEEKERHRKSWLGREAKARAGSRANITEDEKQEVGTGLVVASHFDWDGEAIMKAFAHALEDSNFHEFANEIRTKWLKSFAEPDDTAILIPVVKMHDTAILTPVAKK